MSGEVLARKIAAIRTRTARVRELTPPTVEEFLSRRTEAEALILNLYLALQECSDLALHLVADLGLGIPGEPRAAFEALARALYQRAIYSLFSAPRQKSAVCAR